MTRRHSVQLAVGIVVTIGCFAAALWGFDRADYAEVASSFRRANYLTLPAYLLLLAVFFWLKAIRWALLLEPVRPTNPITARECTSSLMIGFMGNNVLPAHLGDLVRVVVMGRQYGISKTAVFSTVVLERVFDVAAILGILVWGLARAPEAPAGARQTSYMLAAMLAVCVVGIIVYALKTTWFVRTTEWFLERTPLVPQSLKVRAEGMLESGALGMAALRSGRLAFWITVTSIAQWILQVIMIQLSFFAFDIDQPMSVGAIVMGVVAFGVTLPSTPGFFGVIQAAFRYSLEPFGVAPTDAVASSVYYQIVSWIAVTAVGFYYLHKTGIKLTQLEHVAEESEEEVMPSSHAAETAGEASGT